MKITGVESVVVNAVIRNWVFVKVVTDQPGLHGWGEATVELKTRAVTGCIEDLAPMLIGEDPGRIAHLVRKLTVQSFWPLGVIGNAALSGIEQALWDLKGKELGVPVWQLLGGRVRDRIEVYTHLYRGEVAAQRRATTADAIIEGAVETLRLGYKAIKLGIFPPVHYTVDGSALAELSRTAARLREAVGADVQLMYDIHGRSESEDAAIALIDAVAASRPLFVEEPIQPGDNAAMRRIRDAVRVPLATGERLIHQKEFFDLARSAAVVLAQPDPCRVGGIMNVMKIAAIVEAAGMGVALHNPLGPVCGAVCQHLDAVLVNATLQEEARGVVPWYDDVVDHEMVLADGAWPIPRRPGLGVDVNMDQARKHPFKQEEIPAPLRHTDGTLLFA